jgi:hypothetical protein
VHVAHWKEATLQRSEDDWRRALAWRALEEAQRIVAAVGEPVSTKGASGGVTSAEEKQCLGHFEDSFLPDYGSDCGAAVRRF